MTLPAPLARILAIHAFDEETIQKGRLVQATVLAISAIGLLSALMHTALIVLGIGGFYEPIELWVVLLFIPLLTAVSLVLVRNGRPPLAAHLFFITLNIFLGHLFVYFDPNTTYLYLLLISAVSIAMMDRVRSGAVYTAVFILPLVAYAWFNTPQITPNELVTYMLTAFSICLTAWVGANTLQTALRKSVRLAEEQEAQASLLQRRALQLQRSAAVSHTASTSLNPDELLRDIVYTLRDQFGFYFVAIYLLDEAGRFLTLHEATGAAGLEMKQRHYQIDTESTSIVGWVARHSTPRISHDVLEDPIFFNEPLLRETRSELALPLQARGRTLGVLDMQSRQKELFLNEDITILQIMANQVAVNIDNARLFARTQAHLHETETLLTLNTSLSTTQDVGELSRRAARAFADQLTASRCVIWHWDTAVQALISQVMYVRWDNGRFIESYDFTQITRPLAEHPGAAHMLANGPACLHHLSDSHLTPAEKALLADLGQNSSLEIPLRQGEQTQGSVLILRAADQPPLTHEESQLAQVMANELTIALSNAMLTSQMGGRVAQLSALNRLSNILAMAPNLRDIYDGVRREIFSLFEATSMSIILLQPDGETMKWAFAYEYGQEVDLSAIPPLPITQGFSGQVVRSRQHLLINREFQAEAKKYQSITVGVASSSWLGFPLIVANQLIGVLAIENETDPDAFGERDVQLLATIAATVAIAINNQLQFEAVQAALLAQSEQRTQLQTAAEVAAAATSILELDQLLERAVTLIQERFALYYTGLFLIDEATQQAVLHAGTGEAGRIQIQTGHHLAVGGRSLIGGATGDGQPRITQDVTLDEEWQPNPHLPETRSELALPLRVRGRTIGALTVQSTTPGAFGPELISILQTMSDQLAIAIANSRLLAEAENRTRQQQELRRISTQLHNTADIDEIIHVGLRAISDRVKGKSVVLSLGTTGQFREREEGEGNGR
jgi:GAF domain-containing protein